MKLLKKNLLAFDTSTDLASMALAANGRVYNAEQSGIRTHAREILPQIERLLAEAAIDLTQLDAVVFGQGPGSFTGLRVACSVAKGLAYGLNVPLYPVSTLTAICHQTRQSMECDDNDVILAMIDARMHQVYWAYSINPDTISTERVNDAEAIELPYQKPIVLAGVGWETYQHQLNDAIQKNIKASLTVYPRAQAMLELAMRGLIQPKTVDEASPVYIRDQVTQGVTHG